MIHERWVSGGVSLGSVDNFASRRGSGKVIPVHERRAGLDLSEDAGEVKLSGSRSPIYEWSVREDIGAGTSTTRARMTITPAEGTRLRGLHGDLAVPRFDRSVDRIGDRTLIRLAVSDVIVRATMREVKRLQRKHNQGRTWEPAPAGTLRHGQRTRDEIRQRDTKDN